MGRSRDRQARKRICRNMAGQHPLEVARALVDKGESDAALTELTAFLNTAFYNDEALFMLGSIFIERGMNGLGAVLTTSAINSRMADGRSFPEALMNLGAAFKAENDVKSAFDLWQKALADAPDTEMRAKILANISGCFINAGCPEKALEWCNKAIEANPREWGAWVNRGMAYLEMGRWREGWDGWAHTHKTGDRQTRHYIADGRRLPEWTGQPDQTVIVYGDQGIGDEIYFANSLPDMIERCRRVILDCHPRLEALFRRS